MLWICVCLTSQVEAFIDEVNATALCYTPLCNGKLVPVSIKHNAGHCVHLL